MSTLKCDHCLLTFPEQDAVRHEVDGQQKVFCCQGCRGVYRLIHDEGLDEFYKRRVGWKPGPPEDGEITPEPFLDSVKTEGDEREVDIHLSGIRCASCIWLIEHYLGKFKGILDVSVNYATHRARIRWSDEKISLGAILGKIKSLGYLPRPYSASALEGDLEREKKDLLIRFGTASFFSMQLMLYTAALYAGYFQGMDPLYKKVFEFIAWALATPVMFYCGYPFLKNTLRGIRNHTFGMDTLIFLGSFSAYAYSVIAIFIGSEVYFDTSAMIITLILLGRFIESGAKTRAAGAIASLIGLQPKEARMIRSGGPVSVPVSALRTGDRIRVIPGEKIPVDCVVMEGVSEVNESMLTGESMPVRKSKDAEVFGGTMNLNGSLILEVKRTGSDTLISRIIRAVEDAQARKAPIQKMADRVVGWFVPAIIGISVATFVFWFARGNSITSSLMNATSVLVIACPCALGLATPLAVLIGSTLLSSRGILVKGGDIIETLACSDHVCFDKTGTLTVGMPSLVEIVNYGTEKRYLHRIAASLEKNSEHAIAGALRKGIPDGDLLPIEAFKAHAGRGIEGMLNSKRVVAGNMAFLESFQVQITEEQRKNFSSFSSKGYSLIGLAGERELKGWFVIADTLRPEAPEVVQGLKQQGYKVSLLTGDHRTVAEEIGKRAGISEIYAEVLPVRKSDLMREMKESGNGLIMIGDGINDAPALTEADAGVAMGSATDIAMESADVVLLRNDLRLISRLLKTSKKTLSVIRQNLFWAFSYNLIAVPLAVSGMIHPIISAAFMALSSLMVVGNSLRLYREKQ